MKIKTSYQQLWYISTAQITDGLDMMNEQTEFPQDSCCHDEWTTQITEFKNKHVMVSIFTSTCDPIMQQVILIDVVNTHVQLILFLFTAHHTV